jgi:hypothetical protein
MLIHLATSEPKRIQKCNLRSCQRESYTMESFENLLLKAEHVKNLKYVSRLPDLEKFIIETRPGRDKVSACRDGSFVGSCFMCVKFKYCRRLSLSERMPAQEISR